MMITTVFEKFCQSLRTFVKTVDKIRLSSVLKLPLQSVKHHPTKLLYVVLLPGLCRVPTETLGQGCGLHGRFGRRLQTEKQLLQLKGYAHCLLLWRADKFPVVKGIAELWSHVQRLQKAVQVAGHCLINETHVICKQQRQKSVTFL